MDDTYHQILQFYARQARLLDDGRMDEWSETFTEDAVFSVTPGVAIHGRAEIMTDRQELVERLLSIRAVRRHWHGMVDVHAAGAGVAAAASYVVVFEMREDEPAAVRTSGVCEDLLVRKGRGWQVKRREITLDNVPPPI